MQQISSHHHRSNILTKGQAFIQVIPKAEQSQSMAKGRYVQATLPARQRTASLREHCCEYDRHVYFSHRQSHAARGTKGSFLPLTPCLLHLHLVPSLSTLQPLGAQSILTRTISSGLGMDNEIVIDNDDTTDYKTVQETQLKENLDNTVDYDVIQDDIDGSDKMTYKEAQQLNVRDWIEASTCTSGTLCKTVIDKKTKRSKHLHFNPVLKPPKSTSGDDIRATKYISTYISPSGRRLTGIHDDTDCETDCVDLCLDSDWGPEDSAYSDGVNSDASLSYSDTDSNFGSSFDPDGHRELYYKKHDHDGILAEMMNALHGIEEDVTACVRKHFASVTGTARKAFDSSLPYITGSLHLKARELGVDPENLRLCLESVTKCVVQEVVADQLEDLRQRIVDDIDAAVQREVFDSYETQQECLKFAAEGAIEENEEEQRRERRCSEHLHPAHPVSTDPATAQPSLKRSFNQMVDDNMEVDDGDEADTGAEPVTKRMKKLRIHDGEELGQGYPVDVAQRASTSSEARREVRRDVHERSSPSETAPKHTESRSRRGWPHEDDPSYNFNRESALSACSSRQMLMFE